MDKIKEITDLIKSIETDDAEEAQKYADSLMSLTDVIENKLSKLGVQHKLDIDIGEYGSGRMLIVEENHWSGYDVGAWLPSSETC